MPRLYLVRHGHAAATFAEHADPGLDDLGRSQAEAVADHLSRMAPVALVSSPLRRARETSLPLAKLWSRDVDLEPAVSEIPSPGGLGLADRAQWLQAFMAGSWSEASRELAEWREALIATLCAQRQDTVIFSHFVAINAAVGAAERTDRAAIFRPDNCSVTVLDVESGGLRLVERGRESETKVN
jgi:broad specificity phosphatase PhoE